MNAEVRSADGFFFSMPGFPAYTQSLGASRRKVASRYSRAAALDPDIIAAKIVEDFQAVLADLKR